MSVYSNIQTEANTLYRINMTLQHLVKTNRSTLTEEDVANITVSKAYIEQALKALDPVLDKATFKGKSS